MNSRFFFLWASLCFPLLPLVHAADQDLPVRISWGHQSPAAGPFLIKLTSTNAAIVDPIGRELEPGDRAGVAEWNTQAGASDVDTAEFTLRYAEREITVITNLQRIWADLIAQSDPDTARRLREDPAYRPDPRVLIVQMDASGTKGFSLTVDQLLRQKAFWIPSLDVYLAAGSPPRSWENSKREFEEGNPSTILVQVEKEPEATYEQFTARWEDMGNPAYRNPGQTGPGHIVGITWDSALYKFGIDRGAGVWNDYGNPDRFHVWFDFGELGDALKTSWKGQRLADGLPVITTEFETDGIRREVEQFAYPLNGPPSSREGDIPMVLFTRLKLTNPSSETKSAEFRIRHRRLLPEKTGVDLVSKGDAHVLEETTDHSVLLAIQGKGYQVRANDIAESKPAKKERPGQDWKTTELVFTLELGPKASGELILKFPSPLLPRTEKSRLLNKDIAAARQETLAFWSEYLDRGARFTVPEPAVNELFRANLFHALRLPRRHGGAGTDVEIDLPYSNFAYDQRGTPWPVNQAVYVDYMLYDLRGYHALAAEELAAIYRNNQQTNGHVGGYANWGVYTPGMIYSSAKNYLLSGDEAAFERLLPQTLRALDWCLAEVNDSETRSGSASRLVRAPLNDLSGEGVWAFNQAYFYAGFELLGKALARLGHPRAEECQAAAASFRSLVERAFAEAAMRSPLVQLRDKTWTPYVPCEAFTPHRIFQQWYPTDVDTGATHLLRLNALDPRGALADSLLNDHEDNLYLHGWGMANEPVYNQQATAYLLRDDAKAAIRAFYSMMACAFSHSVFEPVEHRWTWGQYFGPPSTDGAWFELYRNMLVRELDDDSLVLLQAAPRKWFEAGKEIRVDRAPTYFGDISLTVRSQADAGRLNAEIEMPTRARPKSLLIRFRHPAARPMQSVTIDGEAWTDFDRAKEWVRITNPVKRAYSIQAIY